MEAQRKALVLADRAKNKGCQNVRKGMDEYNRLKAEEMKKKAYQAYDGVHTYKNEAWSDWLILFKLIDDLILRFLILWIRWYNWYCFVWILFIRNIIIIIRSYFKCKNSTNSKISSFRLSKLMAAFPTSEPKSDRVCSKSSMSRALRKKYHHS